MSTPDEDDLANQRSEVIVNDDGSESTAWKNNMGETEIHTVYPDGRHSAEIHQDDGTVRYATGAADGTETQSVVRADGSAQMTSLNTDGTMTLTSLNPDGTFVASRVDSAGREVEKTRSFEDGKISHAAATYDADGNPTWNRQDSDGMVQERVGTGGGDGVITTVTPEGAHIVQEFVTDPTTHTMSVETVGQDPMTGSPLISHQELSPGAALPQPELPETGPFTGHDPVFGSEPSGGVDAAADPPDAGTPVPEVAIPTDDIAQILDF